MVSFSAIRAFISLIRISMEKLPTLERKGLPIWTIPWSFWQRIWKAIWIQSWTLERPKLATSQGQRKMYNPIPPLATRSHEDRTGGSQVHEGDKTYSIPPAALEGLAPFMCLTQCLQWWKKFAPPTILNLIQQGVEPNLTACPIFSETQTKQQKIQPKLCQPCLKTACFCVWCGQNFLLCNQKDVF